MSCKGGLEGGDCSACGGKVTYGGVGCEADVGVAFISEGVDEVGYGGRQRGGAAENSSMAFKKGSWFGDVFGFDDKEVVAEDGTERLDSYFKRAS